MPSALDQRTTEADQIQRTGSLKRGTDNPKPNGALASDRGREGGTPHKYTAILIVHVTTLLYA